MTAVAFDTLKLARRLQSVGFSREQADGAAEALADTLTGEIATKADMAELKAELKGDILELKLEMQGEFVKVRGEMNDLRGEMTGLRGEMAGLRAEFRGEIAQSRTDMGKWVVSAVLLNMLAYFGTVAAIWQLAHK